MSANERQIGGKHYKTAYEHWDLALLIPMTYLEGCATKYVMRARRKNGKEDLDKALHYIDKMIECFETSRPPDRDLGTTSIEDEVSQFAEANKLSVPEEEIVLAICTHSSLKELLAVREMIVKMSNKAVAVGDGGSQHSQTSQ